MLLNGGELDGVRILAPRTVALMTTNHLTADLLPYKFPESPPRYGYGHGLGVHTMLDHGLAGLPCTNSEYWKDGGAGTLFWVDPDLDLIGIVMYQLLNFSHVPVFDTFRAVVYQALDC
jgi:CubicO group peptidase (beta-lactamase class C family)